MKRLYKRFMLGLCLLGLCVGCHNEEEEERLYPFTSLASDILTRSVQADDFDFQEDAHLRLNTQGYWQMTDADFVYRDQVWSSYASITLHENEDSLDVVALYPYLTQYTVSTLYQEDGSLTDLLYATERQLATGTLSLRLHHLFARLQVHIDADLRDELQSLTCVAPAQITEVSPYTAQVTTNVRAEVSATQAITVSTEYTFLLPIDQVMRVKLRMTYQDGTEAERTLTPTLYHSGQTYICTVTDSRQATGIHDEQEFLEFVELYRTSYNQAVKKYGITQEDRTVFRLLNDLDFSGVDLSNYMPIGTSSTIFKDVFHGMGHTIRHFHAPTNYSAFMQAVNETGIIKDLILENPQITLQTNASYGKSVLVGANSGTIMDCKVLQGKCISSATGSNLGLLAGENDGLILNCMASGEIEVNSAAAGGFVGILKGGSLINCGITDLSLTLKNTSYGGGFCGQSTSGTIQNCWMHFNQATVSSTNGKLGLLVGNLTGLTLRHSFYNTYSTYNLFGNRPNLTSSHAIAYNSKYQVKQTDGTYLPVYTLLNDWISDQSYEIDGQTLLTWTVDSDGFTPTLP